MGTGPGPHGKDLGLLKCNSKVVKGEIVTATFASTERETPNGTAIFKLSPEDAEYFVVGEIYDFKATTP